MLEKLRVWAWIIRNYPVYKYKCWQSRKEKERLNIRTSQESVEYILSSGCSVARFGDGELQMISHLLRQGDKSNFGVDTFQHYDAGLAQRLLKVLKCQDERLMVCLPYQLKHSGISDAYGELFWDREWLARKDFLSQYALDRSLGDTNFTRFYMGRLDIQDYPSYISSLKQIWSNRPLLIVEGELSRLGVGNDLFDGAQSIQRILCPKTNAFAQYDSILAKVREYMQVAEHKDTLIILALGHTATVLAHDLCLDGHQALDLGHIDVEYEWYRMGAKTKVAIPGKYVNEVSSGRIQEGQNSNQKYQSEIIAHIQ